ncbi:uncharacterized protein N7503_007322 [Penicillium pulvis]|uniref:uncharacterized protein n=1 Tax=Penicillium pulvis TaxID=1562058 RepID=UPI00254846A5|nr:uncharacterized protein N7503_007322 [Penicillium pulvis]KAJ5798026.1 hypothetical protein N7503_007322 [Penicillium pulvis]
MSTFEGVLSGGGASRFGSTRLVRAIANQFHCFDSTGPCEFDSLSRGLVDFMGYRGYFALRIRSQRNELLGG